MAIAARIVRISISSKVFGTSTRLPVSLQNSNMRTNSYYLDDLKPGQRFVTGGITLTEAEIISFAWRYDPQPFHLDVKAAEESPYGGLIASGFQSLQFRMVENLLGLKPDQRLQYNNLPYDIVFSGKQKDSLKQSLEDKSLLTHVIDWLERTPFLEFDQFNFLDAYKKAVERMLQKERDAIEATDILSDEIKKQRLTMLGDTNTYFNAVFDKDTFDAMRQRGEIHFSYKAMLAALFIFLYRDEPILQQPYRLLSNLMDVEEMLTLWRNRHAQMVLRMIGRKTGTGGSSGHQYLKATAQQHQIFTDLYQVATLLIPRSDLPALPEELKTHLGYHFSTK